MPGHPAASCPPGCPTCHRASGNRPDWPFWPGRLKAALRTAGPAREPVQAPDGHGSAVGAGRARRAGPASPGRGAGVGGDLEGVRELGGRGLDPCPFVPDQPQALRVAAPHTSRRSARRPRSRRAASLRGVPMTASLNEVSVGPARTSARPSPSTAAPPPRRSRTRSGSGGTSRSSRTTSGSRRHCRPAWSVVSSSIASGRAMCTNPLSPSLRVHDHDRALGRFGHLRHSGLRARWWCEPGLVDTPSTPRTAASALMPLVPGKATGPIVTLAKPGGSPAQEVDVADRSCPEPELRDALATVEVKIVVEAGLFSAATDPGQMSAVALFISGCWCSTRLRPNGYGACLA